MLLGLHRVDSFTITDWGQGFDVVFNYGRGWEPKGLGWDLVMCIPRVATDCYTSSHTPWRAIKFLGGSKT